MIKTLTAYTEEIDDIAYAVEEILGQLNLEKELCKNAAGILSCYSEFVDSGVVAALCEKLPFPVVGATTLCGSVREKMGDLLLTLTVLTSDEIGFSAGLSSSLMETQREPVHEAYRRAASQLPEAPSLMISFLPLLQHVGGDVIIGLLDECSGGVPNFGTVTVDHTPDYHSACTLYNGQHSRDCLAFLLLSGDVSPRFAIASISEGRINKQKTIITAADGNVLQEVNNMPVLQYMNTLGLAKSGSLDGANNIPFIVDFNDGTLPVARAVFALTPEGHAVCGGVMPLNATLAVGTIEYEDVISTTRAALEGLMGTGKRQGLLMFSCIGRYIAMGLNVDAEMRAVQEVTDGAIPYQFSYSGGEICPLMDREGRLINRFHNHTLIACIF